MSAAPVRYSIIVPAYKECANITPLTERVFAALGRNGVQQTETEMIIVDDNSRDGTVEAVKSLQQNGYPVRIIVRTKERGLSSAVLRGFNESRGEFLVCMDADLQHPPESVPALLAKMDHEIKLAPTGDHALHPRSKSKEAKLQKAAVDKKEVEFVIGTRYFQSSDPSVVSIDKDWPLYRRVISNGARMLARPLTPLSDPMTGFFGLRREVFQRANRTGVINPIGFKIALELYVKSRVRCHAEIPIIFGVRVHGESKLSSKVIIGYLRHLRELYNFVFPGVLLGLLVLFVVIFFMMAYKFMPLILS